MEENGLNNKIQEQLNMLAVSMEKLGIADYLQLLNNPLKLMYLNLIAGIARGLGIAIGFTVLTAIIVMILTEMVNLPYIGGVIAQIVRIVQVQLEFPNP